MGLPNLFLQFTNTTLRYLVLNFKMGVSNPNHIWRRLKKMVHIVWVVSLLKCDAIAVKSTRVWLPYKFLMCARKSQLFRLKVEKIRFSMLSFGPFQKRNLLLLFLGTCCNLAQRFGTFLLHNSNVHILLWWENCILVFEFGLRPKEIFLIFQYNKIEIIWYLYWLEVD